MYFRFYGWRHAFISWANWPESSTTLFRRVRQVAVPVGRQITTVFGWVHQNVAPGPKSAVYCCLIAIMTQLPCIADMSSLRVSCCFQNGAIYCIGAWNMLYFLLFIGFIMTCKFLNLLQYFEPMECHFASPYKISSRYQITVMMIFLSSVSCVKTVKGTRGTHLTSVSHWPHAYLIYYRTLDYQRKERCFRYVTCPKLVPSCEKLAVDSRPIGHWFSYKNQTQLVRCSHWNQTGISFGVCVTKSGNQFKTWTLLLLSTYRKSHSSVLLLSLLITVNCLEGTLLSEIRFLFSVSIENDSWGWLAIVCFACH